MNNCFNSNMLSKKKMVNKLFFFSNIKTKNLWAYIFSMAATSHERHRVIALDAIFAIYLHVSDSNVCENPLRNIEF